MKNYTCMKRSRPPIDNSIKRTEWRKFGKLWVAATYEQYLVPFDEGLHFDKCKCGMGILLDNFPVDYERVPNQIRYVCRKCGEQYMIVSPETHLLDIWHEPNDTLM